MLGTHQPLRRRLAQLRAHLAIDAGDQAPVTRDLDVLRGIGAEADQLVNILLTASPPAPRALISSAVGVRAQARAALAAAQEAQGGDRAVGRRGRLQVTSELAQLRAHRAVDSLGLSADGPWAAMVLTVGEHDAVTSWSHREAASGPRLRRMALLIQALVVRRAALVPTPLIADAIIGELAEVDVESLPSSKQRQLLERLRNTMAGERTRISQARSAASIDQVVDALWGALRELRVHWVVRGTSSQPGRPDWWAMVERSLALDRTLAELARGTDLDALWQAYGRAQDLAVRILDVSHAMAATKGLSKN